MTNPPERADSRRHGREHHRADARNRPGRAGQTPRRPCPSHRLPGPQRERPGQTRQKERPGQTRQRERRERPRREGKASRPSQADPCPPPRPGQAGPAWTPPRAQTHRTSRVSPEAVSCRLQARRRRSSHTCPRAGRDRPHQCTGLSHEARRRKPRAIRSQNPGAAELGMAATTWPTAATGASAITVYTNPPEDQAKLRSAGSIE